MSTQRILFSAPMVRALLEGKKTQTRRIIKAKKHKLERQAYIFKIDRVEQDTDGTYSLYAPKDSGRRELFYKCPYGEPGDRPWVRETWRPVSWYPNSYVVQFMADLKNIDIDVPDTSNGEEWIDRMLQRCSDECIAAGIEADDDGMFQWEEDSENPIKWRSPIFMPRWASRITLEITEVRVQRLQEISEEDAAAEGVEPAKLYISDECGPFVAAYSTLWDSINGAGSWDANPWVWAVSFKVVQA